jgi:16S rRNA (uracil1498-N3)-methyltransferase
MPRFYCPVPLTLGQQLRLPENVAHHVLVLRLQPGDLITLFNGDGGEFTASVTSIEKKSATITLQAFSPREVELPYAITLAQALPEGNKLDWIIEKSVELGVTAIQPLTAQRCVVRLAGERAEKKQAHWSAVIAAATEQSGRNRLAHLPPLSSLSDWAAQRDGPTRLLLSPRGALPLSDWARHQPAQAVALIVGPEGGFTESEEKLACDQGAIMVTMGPRILRTETAGLAALAAINALWGQL